MAKKTTHLVQWLVILCAIIFVLLFAIISGFTWNTFRFSLSGIPQNVFTCLSYNNNRETFQLDCFLPHEKKPFYFKNKLICTANTSQTFGKNKWRKNDIERNSITVAKSDYITFNLDLTDKTLIRLSANDGRKV